MLPITQIDPFADIQRGLLAEARRCANSAPIEARNPAEIAIPLRAGALHAIHAGNDLFAAASTGPVGPVEVALGVALHGDEHERGRLDGGTSSVRHHALRYLISPGAPTRAAAEALFGHQPLGGGPAVGALAWHVLVQLAALPARRPVPLRILAELVAVDAAALGGDIASATLPSACAYLDALLPCLQVLGFAFRRDCELVSESLLLAEALQRIADGGAPVPEAPRPAQLERNGRDLLVICCDRVPLRSLETLAVLTPVEVIDAGLQFRLGPETVAGRRRHGTERAVALACGLT